MAVVLLQTSDPKVYAGMLAVTAQANRLYAERQGLTYHAFVGIRRGYHPWQATFNRIPILTELVQNDRFDWVIYLDADAYILDFSFDIASHLAARQHIALIAAAGSTGGKWDINAGIFFLNLKHQAGRRLVDTWHRHFLHDVTEEMLQSGAQPWSFAPNDQDLLQSILKTDNDLLQATEIADFGFINSTAARFARQVLRAHHATLSDRIIYAQLEVAAAIEQTAIPVLPLVDTSPELGTLLPFLLAEWRSRYFFILLLTEQMEERLSAWLSHFPRAHCFALTYEAPPVQVRERADIRQIDPADPAALAELTQVTPRPHLVVDEGSPSALLQQLAFLMLFPTLAPGGYYIVKSRPLAAGAFRPVTDLIAARLAGEGLAWQVGDAERHQAIDSAIGRIHLHRSGRTVQLLAVERR